MKFVENIDIINNIVKVRFKESLNIDWSFGYIQLSRAGYIEKIIIMISMKKNLIIFLCINHKIKYCINNIININVCILNKKNIISVKGILNIKNIMAGIVISK
ncbi:TPA: hypothetical protein QC118_005377 [Bacillus cereus]|nr:hypothetical protein [Bacillus cereus]